MNLVYSVKNPILRDSNPTYHSEICAEYDDWLLIECTGEYEIVDVTTVCFEFHQDAVAFTSRFWTAKITKNEKVSNCGC